MKSSGTKNAFFNVETMDTENKGTLTFQQNPNLIRVREIADNEVKILARQLNLDATNDLSSYNEKFDFDEIKVDPTFKTTNSHCESQFGQSSDNSSIMSRQLASTRLEAERVSALRALKTNLMMILLFVASNLFLLIPSKVWQTYFCIVDTSIQKSLLPIVTTMANFGTVRSVAAQFWNSIVKLKTLNSNK